jgi:hypothetical protein
MSLSMNRCSVGLCVALFALFVASPRVVAEKATQAQLESAAEVGYQLTLADGQINNFKTRGPLATRELKGLDRKVVGPVLKAFKNMMAKAKTAQAATSEVERKYPLLESGKVSYKDYVKLLIKAAKAHDATRSAAEDLLTAAKTAKIKKGRHFNTQALLGYCQTYIEMLDRAKGEFSKLVG